MFKGSVAPTDCESTTNRTGITRTEYYADASGIWTVVTDPAGKKRKVRNDALGRLIEVVEDPEGLNYHTTYEYDPLGNLKTVTQGVQTRIFNYSSLGRLKDATNPESGTISYQYYDSGDLHIKTDARGVTTTMAYDALHRPTTKTYSDGTPTVTYNYHSANTSSAPNIGQLQSLVTSESTNAFTYDSLGRTATSKQTIHINTGDVDFPFSYAWNLNGSLSTEVYPSGRQVSYSIDAVGRTNKVNDATRVYADMTGVDSASAFTPDGRIARMKLGNNLWVTRDFQTPGTPTVYKLGTGLNLGDLLQLEYNFDPTANNGNVMSQTIIRSNGSWHQAYQYDGVNRLLDAIETGGFHQQYGYDQYGNRTATVSTGLAHDDASELNSIYNPSNNRLLSNQSGTLNYDIAGNQTNYGSFTLGYDANNLTKSFTSPSSNGTYGYDGVDKRVKKVVTSGNGTTTTYYVYDALGRLAAEYSDQTVTNSGTSWIFTDMLGSTRAITSNAGSSGYGSVTECYDYLPFGRILSSSDNGRGSCYPLDPDDQVDSAIPQKFTGKERDAETGLDYFGFRYYSSGQGRWTSPDPLLISANIEDPQTWNRYVYVLDNPLIYIDPNGLFPNPAYNVLNDQQKRILENTEYSIRNQTYCGEALWNALETMRRGVARKNAFINVTNRLASVIFESNLDALSQINYIIDFRPDRIIANVCGSLYTLIHDRVPAQFKIAWAGLHAPYNFQSFKDTLYRFGNIQFSFAQSTVAVDIDIDINNAVYGPGGAWAHFWEGFFNTIFLHKTDQNTVRRLLIDVLHISVTPSPDTTWN
jgi:RHS repeat-associated protein